MRISLNRIMELKVENLWLDSDYDALLQVIQSITHELMDTKHRLNEVIYRNEKLEEFIHRADHDKN